jgi:O-antigen ligase
MVLFVCGVGAHQGFADTGCVVIDESVPGDTASGKPDGRSCTTARSCYTSEAEPGAEYQCEHIGLFGTTSIGHGRVRYRGVLQDPNELALAGGVGLPLAFAFGQVERRSIARLVLSTVSFLLVLLCAVMTASRGGQLVFLAVLGAYFVHRVGLTGLLLGAILALPLLLLGGRGGEDASSSTLERLDCWAEALSMFRAHPLLGVGLGQFTEHHYMTAHNSYLLALAELGFPGMVLFVAILYCSARIPLQALGQLRHPQQPAWLAGAPLIRAWSVGLAAAFIGLAVGIFFLSFTYHYVLWIYVGLAGALYSAIRQHDPTFRVRLSWLELGGITTTCALIVVAVFLYTRWKLGA